MTQSAGSTTGAVAIAAGDYAATVSTTGAALSALTWRGGDLVLPYAPDDGPQLSQGQVLLPWPNRVDGGRYTFDGATHALEVTEPARGNAIHGLTHAAAWAVAEATDTTALLSYRLEGAPGYPGTLDLTVGYDLDPERGLTVEITAVNIGDAPAPYGNGSHSYLTLGGPVDDAELTLPASLRQPVNERMIPDGPSVAVDDTPYDFRRPRLIGDTVLDTAFTGLAPRDARGRVHAVLSGPDHAVALWADETYRWLQVFSADRSGHPMQRRGLAVEPMTCPPNAFASGVDLIVLHPGETATSRHGIVRVPRTAAPGSS